MDALTSKQLRWFSKKCGCKDGGSLNKFNIRVLIAQTKNSKTKYDKLDDDKIDGFSKPLCNNHLRVINAVFFDDLNYSMFLKTNDRKDRKELEGVDGGNGPKNELFWAEVASTCNNPYGEFNCDFVQPAKYDKAYEFFLSKPTILGFTPGYSGAGRSLPTYKLYDFNQQLNQNSGKDVSKNGGIGYTTHIHILSSQSKTAV